MENTLTTAATARTESWAKGSWIQTYSGTPFYPSNPSEQDIKIVDIAHALSNLCRFAGHTESFYSVAQHSVLVSHACAPEDALWGLLHDASEAYLVDIPRPIKHLPEMAPYRRMEKQLMELVARKFGLPLPEPESVQLADKAVLFTEKRDLLKICTEEWGYHVEPLPERIQCWTPKAARLMFLYRFNDLTGTAISKSDASL